MKIKKIFAFGLFLLSIVNIKGQGSLEKLKIAIDNLNLEQVEKIISNNPNLINAQINNKNLLNYTLNSLDDVVRLISFAQTPIEIGSIALDLENGKRILEFLERSGALVNNDYTFNKLNLFQKEEYKKSSRVNPQLIVLIKAITEGNIGDAIDLVNNPDFDALERYFIQINSPLFQIVEFLKLSIEGDFSQDEDILKSILLGEICHGCDANKVSRSKEWKIYNIAKENNFKSLVKFIRERAGAILGLKHKDLPPEMKREITKFL